MLKQHFLQQIRCLLVNVKQKHYEQQLIIYLLINVKQKYY